ncbi:protein AUXIN-REGULATED GENE INVOLVED IN ORGAN SIZE-like [Phragmites australis]|uniref:protein AUXIN-REGULATED GENE INVOLVED IN ORGAN SIZE-like n=1 Tax=Phragmites australis TaxID=29695 RepID=UPI002D795B05|nr:protein AUXIN-REGULATED GENE INVOLVED IN ORGAN SIZE-like [Phragmites australis]
MFLSPRNEPQEDTQELINSTGPNCCPSSAAPGDMESGGRAAARTSTSDQLRVHTEEPSRGGSFWARHFSVSFLLLVGVTASLVILPLVLPPLPPPPSILMLVPVAMLVVLVVLAFMPTSVSRSGTGPAYL